MLQFFLILMGLISQPDSNHTTNCGNNGDTTTVTQQNQADTGGEERHPKPPKIIGG